MLVINRNPLRYPGGKHFLTGYIRQVILDNDLRGCVFYEPYAGSAAVSLSLLSEDVVERAIIVELDPLVYAFWQCVMTRAVPLCEAIMALDVTLDTWHAMLPLKRLRVPDEHNLLQLGLAGLFFNRTSYSGILKAGPLGGQGQQSGYNIDCRFNKETTIAHIQRITRFGRRLTVHWGDALSFMRSQQATLNQGPSFTYIDPPYYEQGKRLYRHYYQDQDHRELAALIKPCSYPWLLSYDDHPFINDLYFNPNTHIQKLYRDYSVGSQPTPKRARELLISNLRIPPARSLRYAVSPADD
jgi:DNA adenine methylase